MERKARGGGSRSDLVGDGDLSGAVVVLVHGEPHGSSMLDGDRYCHDARGIGMCRLLEQGSLTHVYCGLSNSREFRKPGSLAPFLIATHVSVVLKESERL